MAHPIALSTPVLDLLDRWVLASAGDDYLAFRVQRGRRHDTPRSPVHAQVVFSSGRPSQSRWLSEHSTVDSIGVGSGLVLDRAVVVAEVHPRLFREPLVKLSASDALLPGREAMGLLPPRPDRRQLAIARVDRVKETYGLLVGDITYRIEYSALFDPTVPLTRDFETALVLWSDIDETTAETEVTRLAGLVQVTFEAARAHAETVGFAHLPEAMVDTARRAAKASRLAAEASSEGERDAAMAQTIRLLDALALDYLPTELAVRKQLEPKR